MGLFKKFLMEEDTIDINTLSSEELLQIIEDELADMDEDEIFAFGYVLYYEFFEDEENPDDNYDDFEIEDVKTMIRMLGAEYYIDIIDLLLPDEEEDGFDWDSIEIDSEEAVDEAVGRIMKRKNFNRKKRKFFKKTKADLRKGISARRKANRLNKSKRKKFYRINKKRIASYQKSRAVAIKKGRHMKKVRRGA